MTKNYQPTVTNRQNYYMYKEDFNTSCPTGDLITMGISVNNSTQSINNNLMIGEYSEYILTINQVLTNSPFIIITNDQKNGTALNIVVSLTNGTTTDSITTLWLASESHSDCTYCGTLQNNSHYQTTWIGNDGNYLWSTPVYVSQSITENFQSKCPLSFFYMTVTLDNFPINNTWINGEYNEGLLTITDILEPTMEFMIVTSDQKNGTILTIAVSIRSDYLNSISTMWMASANHSSCTYCGTLQNNSVYQTTWIGNDGNYLWSTPVLMSSTLPPIENFQASCPPPPRSNTTYMIILTIIILVVLMILLFILFKSRK